MVVQVVLGKISHGCNLNRHTIKLVLIQCVAGDFKHHIVHAGIAGLGKKLLHTGGAANCGVQVI